MNDFRLDRSQWLLILAACLLGNLSTVGAALPYPILPPLFVGPLHHPVRDFLGIAPKVLFGIALAVNPVGLLLGSSLLGPLSDRFGRRRTLVLTVLIGAVGHLLSAWALVAGAYLPFVVARLVTGLAEGNIAITRAMLADRIHGAARTRAFAWFNSALYIGWLIGPLLAGLTLGFGTAVPFVVAGGALLVSAGVTLKVLPVDGPPHAGGGLWAHARERHALNLLRVPAIRQLFTLQLLFTLGLTSFYEFYPVWLVEVANYGPRGIAWVTAALCLVLASGSGLASHAHRLPPLRMAALSALLASGCFLTVALAGARWGLAAIALAGLPISIYNALVQAEVSRRFGGEHGQGAVMGLVSTIFCVSNIVAALLGSVLALLDTRAILGTGAVLSALAAWGLGRRRD